MVKLINPSHRSSGSRERHCFLKSACASRSHWAKTMSNDYERFINCRLPQGGPGPPPAQASVNYICFISSQLPCCSPSLFQARHLLTTFATRGSYSPRHVQNKIANMKENNVFLIYIFVTNDSNMRTWQDRWSFGPCCICG